MKHMYDMTFRAGAGLPRRSFLALAAGAVAAGVPGCAKRAASGGGAAYSVALLGDTHFDSTDSGFYHANYLGSTTKERYERHLAEHVRNAEMWRERMPALLRASAASVGQDAAFILQMGDLVQGDCNDVSVHRRMLDDAFRAIKGVYGNRLPLVSVVGNHDIRGTGALETFDSWQAERVSKELGRKVDDTTFLFRHGPDAFLLVDFNEPCPDFDRLLKLLDESAGARHLFLVSHGPAIPSGSSRWFLLGGEKRSEQRRDLLHRLAKRNAIVLSGHTHKLEHYECVLPEGRVTQFVASSVWTDPKLASPRFVDNGAKDYGNRLKAAKGRQRDGSTPESLAALVEEYRPYVRDYSYALGAGHFRLDVSGKRVAVAFFGGESLVPAHTYLLRG